MKSKIVGALGSMMLGAVLTLPLADLTQAATDSRRVQSANPELRRIDRSILDAQGPIDVVVQLAGEPLAVANGPDARRRGGRMNRGQQVAYSQKIRRDQDAVLAKVLALGGKEIGRVQIAYNAALVRIDASKAEAIANLPGVRSVQRASDFHINLTETVPYVGAAAVQAAGVTGKGVRVAVLDSGVDYTHRNLGGPGTVEAYKKAITSATSRSGVFAPSPTDKVFEGYDFVGEHWDGDKYRTLEPDDNPIDTDGHGTHVADIIAGRSNDGTHVGVAPGVSLLAVKVCSAVSTACSGFAILQGIDYALDPNGDKSMDDAVDIINLSVAAPYGQKEDSTAVAASNAVKAGVVVVTVAGNSGDKPYDLGSPGIAPEVITVAQTQVPSATAIPLVIKSPVSLADTYLNTAVLSFARVTTGVQAPVVYLGTGCPNETYPVSPAGKIALIDRGGTNCDVSAKIARAGKAGAVGTIIAMVDESAPMSFSNGGDCPPPGGSCVPSVVIEKALADSIRANLNAGVVAEISPKNGIALTSSMASTSARGPSYDYNNQIKPDLAAPGASVSARVGTGSGEEAFSGTSGSAPMVAGAAALMLEAYPDRSPWEIKAALMNTADPEVYTDPVFLPGELAPITRMGAGELQVNKAMATTTAAWDAARRTGSLSFGYRNVSDSNETLVRTVRVQNYSRSPRRYDVSNVFRYSNDAASRAVKILTPGSVVVPPFGTTTFDVVMKIDASKLPIWGFFGGANAGNGPLLQSVEYDGFITLKDSRDTVRLPWHVLPHRSAEVRAVTRNVIIPNKGFGLLALANSGRALTGIVDVFNLTGTSPRLRPWQVPDEDETTVHDLAAVGVRATVDNVGLPIVQFAIHTYGRRAHPAYPGGFNVFVDSNNDGKPDFRIFNAEWHGFDSDGVTVIAVDDLSTDADNGNMPVYYYADADLNSSNLIMSVPPQAIGVRPGVPIRFSVEARDNYFADRETDGLTDAIRGMVFTLDKPRYSVQTDGAAEIGVPARGGLILKVNEVPGGDRASPSQTGFLMMYRDAAEEAETVSVYKVGAALSRRTPAPLDGRRRSR